MYGIDYDKGLLNCMGDLVFFKTLLSMFLRDDCFARAKSAYAAGNQREMFACLHELKGVSGNAALVALYDAVAPIVEKLRCATPDEKELRELFVTAEAVYNRTCEGIRLAVGDEA